MIARTARREYLFGKTLIRYRLSRSPRRKTLLIAVDPLRGVLVRAPGDLPEVRVLPILRKKAPWILDRLRLARQTRIPEHREFVSGESFPYLGRNYRLKLTFDVESPIRAAIVGKRLSVNVPQRVGIRGMVRDTVRAWYRARALACFPSRAAFWAKLLGRKAPTVLVRGQAKRWGSCDRQGRLLVNWRIVMAPLSLVDYVIAHETCHLIRPDHGPAFWRLMSRLMSDWESRRARLRRNGPQYSL